MSYIGPYTNGPYKIPVTNTLAKRLTFFALDTNRLLATFISLQTGTLCPYWRERAQRS